MDPLHTGSIANLVTGLAQDIRLLISQELRLAKREIRLEINKLVRSIIQGLIGLVVALIGIACALLMLVHLLQQLTGWPLWACYGLTAIIALGIGGFLFLQALRAGTGFRLWPIRATHSIKEDARWIKEQILSTKT